MNEKGVSPPKWVAQQREWIMLPAVIRWFNELWSNFPKVRTFSVQWNPTSVAANTTSAQTVTVAGLRTDDVVHVNKPSHQAGLGIVGERVSADDTLEITFMNTTASPIDPSDETYSGFAIRL